MIIQCSWVIQSSSVRNAFTTFHGAIGENVVMAVPSASAPMILMGHMMVYKWSRVGLLTPHDIDMLWYCPLVLYIAIAYQPSHSQWLMSLSVCLSVGDVHDDKCRVVNDRIRQICWQIYLIWVDAACGTLWKRLCTYHLWFQVGYIYIYIYTVSSLFLITLESLQHFISDLIYFPVDVIRRQQS